MKLHIPEIGTKLTLSAPWSFWVYPEGRNSTLLVATGLSQFFTVDHQRGFDGPPKHDPEDVASEAQERQRRESVLKLTGRGSWVHNLIRWNGTPVNAHSHSDYYTRLGEVALPETFTLPVGTILTVDRVYIRKGKGMSVFSSITFLLDKKSVPAFADAPGMVGFGRRGSLRFWAKLACVNSMEVAD